jgi:phosphoglycerol transferase MdoB-like AlkP superfamily enzyme
MLIAEAPNELLSGPVASSNTARKPPSQTRALILFVGFYAIAANAPYWAAGRVLSLLPLGWVSVEYMAVGVLALFVPRALASFLLLLMIAADLTASICRTFHLYPYECFANLGIAQDLPLSRLLTTAAICLLIALVVAIPIAFPARRLPLPTRRRAALALVLLAVLAMTTDTLRMARDFHAIGNYARNDVNHTGNWSNLWTGRYPLLHLARNPHFFPAKPLSMTVSLKDSPPIASATQVALASSGLLSPQTAAHQPNLVLILVESWGSALDPTVATALTQPYSKPQLLARYRVLQGDVPFYGATVGGETRELCQSTTGIDITQIPSDGLLSCLPARLASAGYTTIALHGSDGRVFDRVSWYRRLGFDQQWFGPEFRRLNLPDCVGAFVGTCDADIARFIEQRLAATSPNPLFLQWVTLNSHLPVPVPNGLAHPAPCAFAPNLPHASSLCSWYQLVANVHASAAGMALAPQARPTVFVIVGDHPPPFNSAALNDHFSQSAVPYIILIPRESTP